VGEREEAAEEEMEEDDDSDEMAHTTDPDPTLT